MKDIKIIVGDMVGVHAYGADRLGKVLDIDSTGCAEVDIDAGIGMVHVKVEDMKFVSRDVVLGRVGVDSGQLLISDPCIVDSQWKKDEYDNDKISDRKLSYNSCCHATGIDRIMKYEGEESDAPGGELGDNVGPCQLLYDMGHSGAGVCVPTGSYAQSGI